VEKDMFLPGGAVDGNQVIMTEEYKDACLGAITYDLALEALTHFLPFAGYDWIPEGNGHTPEFINETEIGEEVHCFYYKPLPSPSGVEIVNHCRRMVAHGIIEWLKYGDYEPEESFVEAMGKSYLGI
jgi:hypothetical protein